MVRYRLPVFATVMLLSLPLMTTHQVSASQRQIQASSRSVTGAANAGLALSLTSQANVFHVGQPMIVTVETRNTSAALILVDFLVKGHSYTFSVTDQSGNLLPLLARAGGPAGGPPNPIPVGKSAFIDVNLSDYVDLSRPGTYVVIARTDSVYLWGTREPGTLKEQHLDLASNKVVIQVVP